MIKLEAMQSFIKTVQPVHKVQNSVGCLKSQIIKKFTVINNALRLLKTNLPLTALV